VALIVGASWISYYVRAQRWRVLLRPVAEVPFYPALSATVVGFGATMVMPLRVGELVRPALLGRRVGIRMSAAISSVVLERLFDMLLVILCFLPVGLLYPIPAYLKRTAAVLAILASAGFIVLLVVQRNHARARAMLDWLLARVPTRLARRLRPVAEGFLDGLGGLADGWTVVVVLAYSAYLWGVITLTYLFALLALDIAVPSLVATSLATMVIVAAFVFLPQAPGFVGTWQAGCVLALGLFGVPKEQAVGYSLLTWTIQMVVNIGTAGAFLAREDLSLRQVLQVAEREAPAAGAEG
jgi:hypothetical protein